MGAGYVLKGHMSSCSAEDSAPDGGDAGNWRSGMDGERAILARRQHERGHLRTARMGVVLQSVNHGNARPLAGD